MAKKQKKAAKKTGASKRASAKKTGAKKAPAKRPAARTSGRSPSGPQKVSTGRGPTPAEIGASLVEMFNAGKLQEIENRWWAPEITSVEGIGMAFVGRKAVEAKNSGWMQENTLHGASAEGPFVGASGFAVRFRMDVEERASGRRTLMDEVGVYTVQNGKIVREEFMYGSMTPAPGSRPS